MNDPKAKRQMLDIARGMAALLDAEDLSRDK
jgi:hypothetical protein